METAATNALSTDAAAPEGTQVTDSAPVETTEVETTDVEKTEKPKADAKADSEPEWFQKRMGEMTARWRQLERENQAMARELEHRKAAEAPKADDKPKTLADFEFDETKYQNYLFETAERRAVEAADKRDKERVERVNAERRARKFQEREISFEKEAPDYREVAHYAPITDGIAELLQELESGPELAYYLGKNRDVALTLGDLPVGMAAIELGRIDARLQAKRQAKNAALEKARAAKAVTNAPDPARTIEGTGDPSGIDVTSADSDKLSDAEWQRRREKQLQRKRK